MYRAVGWITILVAGALIGLSDLVSQFSSVLASTMIGPYPTEFLISKLLLVMAVLSGFTGIYILILQFLQRTATKRRLHDIRNILRLAFGTIGLIVALGVLTDQWLGVLLSLGVVGFAVTFALQQPLLSLLGWFYILVKRPYSVGDRIRISDTKGDVIKVDFLVTTIWEIGGELISTNQPSGRVVTVPNSVVLSSEVTNFGGGGSQYVWNEIQLQVSYETDIAVASDIMIEEATAVVGTEMADSIADFRDRLADTPVELEVNDEPTVNITQSESWVELRLRYITHPRQGTRIKNELYDRILDRFNDQPTVTSFPVSRNR